MAILNGSNELLSLQVDKERTMTKDQKAAWESDTERQLWLHNELRERHKNPPRSFSLLANIGRSQEDAQCAIWALYVKQAATISDLRPGQV